jgi:hypothetical protein
MLKISLFILFVFFTSSIFSQKNDEKTKEQAKTMIINKNSAPKLIAFDKSEWNENNNSLIKDTLLKPELKLFAINQFDSNGKKTDSIIISEPKLIPYSGYKKENDN